MRKNKIKKSNEIKKVKIDFKKICSKVYTHQRGEYFFFFFAMKFAFYRVRSELFESTRPWCNNIRPFFFLLCSQLLNSRVGLQETKQHTRNEKTNQA